MVKASWKHLVATIVMTVLAGAGVAACEKQGGKSADKSAPAPGGEVLATVDGHKVYVEEFERAVRRLPPQVRSGLTDPEKKEEFLNRFLEEKLLYIEAKERGLDEDPETRARIEEYTERVLTQALHRELSKEPIDQARVEAYYNEHLDDYTEERSRYSMILLRRPRNRTTEDDERLQKLANDLHRRLKRGADFAELARKHSEEPRSAPQGGDLGYVDLNRWGRRLSQVGETLKVGEISEPVQVGYGWVILKRESEPKTITAPLAEVRGRIIQRLRIERIDEFKEKLRTEATIDVREDALAQANLGTSPTTPLRGNRAMQQNGASDGRPDAGRAEEESTPAEESGDAESAE